MNRSIQEWKRQQVSIGETPPSLVHCILGHKLPSLWLLPSILCPMTAFKMLVCSLICIANDQNFWPVSLPSGSLTIYIEEFRMPKASGSGVATSPRCFHSTIEIEMEYLSPPLELPTSHKFRREERQRLINRTQNHQERKRQPMNSIYLRFVLCVFVIGCLHFYIYCRNLYRDLSLSLSFFEKFQSGIHQRSESIILIPIYIN